MFIEEVTYLAFKTNRLDHCADVHKHFDTLYVLIKNKLIYFLTVLW